MIKTFERNTNYFFNHIWVFSSILQWKPFFSNIKSATITILCWNLIFSYVKSFQSRSETSFGDIGMFLRFWELLNFCPTLCNTLRHINSKLRRKEITLSLYVVTKLAYCNWYRSGHINHLLIYSIWKTVICRREVFNTVLIWTYTVMGLQVFPKKLFSKWTVFFFSTFTYTT